MVTTIQQETIALFMNEAKKIHTGPRSGIKPEFHEAVGLVETCVAFECFINSLEHNKSIYKKRQKFCLEYSSLYKNQIKCLSPYITLLKKELEAKPLEDMTPNTTLSAISITSVDNLNEIIEVIYRIRSNLVHGSKELSNERNKLLIYNSFHLLYTLLELIFTKERLIS